MKVIDVFNMQSATGLFRQHGVSKAALFGSVARGEETERSDIDLLVSFSKKYDLLDLIGLKQDLEELYHRPVDVIAYDALKNDAFSRHILQESRVIYEQNS